jgi:hypothetical protein
VLRGSCVIIGEANIGNRVNHQDLVKKFLDTKAVDFVALGKVVAEAGPSLSVADEPWQGICGTMRTFFHCYIIKLPPPTVEPPVVESE